MSVHKKILILLAFVIFFFIFTPKSSFAHPIGNTDSYFYYGYEIDGAALDSNVIRVYTYINWFQSAFLVEKETGILESDIFKLMEYQDLYGQYVSDHIKIHNNEDECSIIIDESPVLEDQISLSIGTLVISTFDCTSAIENVKIENSLFIEDFALQSNFTSIYNLDDLLHAVTIDLDNPVYEFNASELLTNPKGDQLVDNSANMSAEEVMDSFQKGTIVGSAGGNGSNAQGTSGSSRNPGPKKASFLTAITDTLFLKTNAIKDQSVAFLLGLVFLLGFLHTIEAGHSKAILASSMLHHKMNIRKGLSYAAVFTLTHLADIIIVGVILLAADNYFDILSNFTMIEKFAGYALLLMAIYLLFKNAQPLVRKWVLKRVNLKVHDHGHDHNHDHPHDHGHDHAHFEAGPDVTFKDQLMLGFLAGLAPCVFGWSIFMLILSTNKIWVLIPAILFFGLGIFIALSFVVFIMTHLKKGAYNRFEKIAEISPIISAIFLLGYALILVF